jgi:1,4-dihydroxy-2-naphthoyl-CoA synthase
VVRVDQLRDQTMQLAREIAHMDPFALRMTKRAVT